MTAIRSWLYVPGDQPDKLAKAAERGADALIVDLEDAVVPGAKDAARTAVVSWLRGGRPTGPGAPEAWVRVNNGPLLTRDLEVIGAAGPDGIILPKADLTSIQRAIQVLGVHDAPLSALIETGTGMVEAAQIAAVPRISRVAIGEADLAAELGITPSDDERELWPLRMQLVVACAAAGIAPPCGPVSTNFRDLDAYRSSTEALRRAGFGSRSAIHPAQVEIVNDVFTPSADEVDRARRLVDAFDRSVANGDGIAVDDDGKMVDEAVVRSARRTLELAERPT